VRNVIICEVLLMSDNKKLAESDQSPSHPACLPDQLFKVQLQATLNFAPACIRLGISNRLLDRE
jgi:hypothetical protein